MIVGAPPLQMGEQVWGLLSFEKGHQSVFCDVWVQPLEMVDNSTSPLQTHFEPDFCDVAVQAGHLFPERGSVRVLLLAAPLISPRHATATPSDFGASQAETGGNGQESTSRAVHCRLVLPAAIAGVRSR